MATASVGEPDAGHAGPAGRPTVRAAAALLAGAAVVGAALAPLGGWLWVALSHPPRVPLTRGGGLLLGEQALNQQSGITLWFIVLGVVLGAVCGLVLGALGQRFGWLTVLAVLVLCAVASIGSRYAGVHVFGADPHAEAAHAEIGDEIRLDVGLDTRVAYLGWPIGGLLGALAAIAGWSRSARPPGAARPAGATAGLGQPPVDHPAEEADDGRAGES